MHKVTSGCIGRTVQFGLAVSALAAFLTTAAADWKHGDGSNLPLSTLCDSFDPKQLPHDAEIISKAIRPASAQFGPEVCIVRGTIVTSPASTINWAVELLHPTVWNGKTLTFGGGGFDGFIPTDYTYLRDFIGAPAHPYVKMGSDSGHQTTEGFPFGFFYPWALNDDALRNHGYVANHLTLEVGTYLAKKFYGKAPKRRYMVGHSNGGRSGLLSANHYPKDYDGIIALAPAISQQSHGFNVPQVFTHVFASPDNWLSPQKVALFAAAETAACDELDGLADGMIGNIAACNHTGADLLCQGPETPNCLTAGQLESIRLIYTDKTGVAMNDGLSPGYQRWGRGASATGDFTGYIFGTDFNARDSFNYFADTEHAKVVANDPNENAVTIQPENYVPEHLRLSSQLDPTNHNLSPFADHGGKLIVWYGLGDTCVTVYRTAEYFEKVMASMGEKKVRKFARLLTVPSIGHDFTGPGPDRVDLIGALEAWVEDGQAPDALVASKFSGGNPNPVFQRPLCEWPTFPRYNGTGDPTQASSFTCSDG